MKRVVLFSAFALLLIFGLPLLLYTPKAEPAPAPEDSAAPEPTAPSPEPSAEPVADSAILLTVQREGTAEPLTMAEYLPLALAGEMPASFQPEALRAQAVALRSYALYYQAERKSAHPEADICGDAGCCAAMASLPALKEAWGENFAAYYDKICAAVRDTDGQYLVWEETPALTVFHASSAGRTEAGSALGMPRPYLLSVETPETDETVKNLLSSVEVSDGEFQRAVRSLAPEAEFSGGRESWLGETSLDTAGRVTALEIGGVRLSGLAIRQLFGLRSTDFTLEPTESGFVFHVRGYGHGLGMSQYGAELMARDGAGYADILRHFYPGTELVVALR